MAPAIAPRPSAPPAAISVSSTSGPSPIRQPYTPALYASPIRQPYTPALYAQDKRQGRALYPDRPARMGLRSGLPHLGSPRRCVADLAAPIQLAPAAQQSTIKSARQPPRSCRGQPGEAPQLARFSGPAAAPRRLLIRGASCSFHLISW